VNAFASLRDPCSTRKAGPVPSCVTRRSSVVVAPSKITSPETLRNAGVNVVPIPTPLFVNLTFSFSAKVPPENSERYDVVLPTPRIDCHQKYISIHQLDR
jgi:hypothetical protein